MSETMVVPGGAFGKQLANSDKKVRDRAVRGLQKWLISNEELTDLQLLKLWKGLFYCFWMSDKPMIQEHLADKLAAVVMKLPEGNGLRYMKAFWTIMIKEWHGIDRLRLDKFYMLLRKFHFYGFRYLQTKEWEQSVVEQYLNLLIKGPLRPNDLKVPDGLRYHTSEVYLDELRKAVSSEPSKETKVQLLQPFFVNLASSASDTVFSRIQDNIFKSILKQALSEEASVESEKSAGWRFDEVEVGRRLLAISESTDTIIKNRSKVEKLFKEYASALDKSIVWTTAEGKTSSKKKGKTARLADKPLILRARKVDENDMQVDSADETPVSTATATEASSPQKKRKATSDSETEPAAKTKRNNNKKRKTSQASEAEVEAAQVDASQDSMVEEANGADTVQVTNTHVEISQETVETPKTPKGKGKKSEAKTVPSKRLEQFVKAPDSDPTHKKSVLFVLDKNEVKEFRRREPVADEGTPTRKTEVDAKKVLKPAPPPMLAEELERLIKSADTADVKAAELGRLAMESAMESAMEGAVSTSSFTVTTTKTTTPSKNNKKSAGGRSTATPKSNGKKKTPKGSAKKRPIAADFM